MFRALKPGTDLPQHSISFVKSTRGSPVDYLAMNDEDALKSAKIQRRCAKASLTRLGKALAVLEENERPASEVSEALVKVKQAFDNVVSKHETYTNLIEDEEEFLTE